jgi:hypothetical protein
VLPPCACGLRIGRGRRSPSRHRGTGSVTGTTPSMRWRSRSCDGVSDGPSLAIPTAQTTPCCGEHGRPVRSARRRSHRKGRVVPVRPAGACSHRRIAVRRKGIDCCTAEVCSGCWVDAPLLRGSPPSRLWPFGRLSMRLSVLAVITLLSAPACSSRDTSSAPAISNGPDKASAPALQIPSVPRSPSGS